MPTIPTYTAFTVAGLVPDTVAPTTFTPTGLTPDATPPTAFTPTGLTPDTVAPVVFSHASFAADTVAPLAFAAIFNASSSTPVGFFPYYKYPSSVEQLRGYPTKTITSGSNEEIFVVNGSSWALFVLTAGAHADDGVTNIQPFDYDPTTNTQYWVLTNSGTINGGTTFIDSSGNTLVDSGGNSISA